jgi:hypothetical protein
MRPPKDRKQDTDDRRWERGERATDVLTEEEGLGDLRRSRTQRLWF